MQLRRTRFSLAWIMLWLLLATAIIATALRSWSFLRPGYLTREMQESANQTWSATDTRSLGLERGCIVLELYYVGPPDLPPDGRQDVRWNVHHISIFGTRYTLGAPRWLSRIGIDWNWQQLASISRIYREGAFTIPLWLLIVSSLILAATMYTRATRPRRRMAAGLCAHCGYDIRATPQRCPECGQAGVTRASA